MRRTLWLALLLGLLAGPVGAAAPPASRLAADDLALSRLLLQQQGPMQEAARALEDWAAGRLVTPEALTRARQAEARCRSLEAEVGRRAASVPDPLGGSAREVARGRTALVAGVVQLVRRGKASRAELLAFNRQQGKAAARNLEAWLSSRISVARQVLGSSASPPTLSYYRWLGALLPLQLQELALGQRLRAVLDDLAEGGSPGASGLYREGQALAGRVGALPGAGFLAPAQRAAAREAESLVRLAEAVELMAADPSEESGARVTRWSASVQKDSAQAEEESLQALATSLHH